MKSIALIVIPLFFVILFIRSFISENWKAIKRWEIVIGSLLIVSAGVIGLIPESMLADPNINAAADIGEILFFAIGIFLILSTALHLAMKENSIVRRNLKSLENHQKTDETNQVATTSEAKNNLDFSEIAVEDAENFLNDALLKLKAYLPEISLSVISVDDKKYNFRFHASTDINLKQDSYNLAALTEYYNALVKMTSREIKTSAEMDFIWPEPIRSSIPETRSRKPQSAILHRAPDNLSRKYFLVIESFGNSSIRNGLLNEIPFLFNYAITIYDLKRRIEIEAEQKPGSANRKLTNTELNNGIKKFFVNINSGTSHILERFSNGGSFSEKELDDLKVWLTYINQAASAGMEILSQFGSKKQISTE
ncbi:MAG: hypothetical protein GF315_12755 [candidate division Zixibacteria bacterium]|nr:hypothetical protein [candidate division Zixibacteria bacterium]